MAGSVNKVILVGNLGKDPEVRTTQDGTKIVNLTLATSENWNDRASGERKERTEWHRVVIFNDRIGEVAERYLRKGRKVYVEGALQTRKWTDQSGQERYTTEVVIGRFRGELTVLDTAAQRGRRGAECDAQLPPPRWVPQAAEVGAAAAGGRRRRVATWTTKFRSDGGPGQRVFPRAATCHVSITWPSRLITTSSCRLLTTQTWFGRTLTLVSERRLRPAAGQVDHAMLLVQPLDHRIRIIDQQAVSRARPRARPCRWSGSSCRRRSPRGPRSAG